MYILQEFLCTLLKQRNNAYHTLLCLSSTIADSTKSLTFDPLDPLKMFKNLLNIERGIELPNPISFLIFLNLS
jgi:hypothetical protein